MGVVHIHNNKLYMYHVADYLISCVPKTKNKRELVVNMESLFAVLSQDKDTRLRVILDCYLKELWNIKLGRKNLIWNFPQ